VFVKIHGEIDGGIEVFKALFIRHQALEHLDSSVDFAVDLDEHLNGSFRYGFGTDVYGSFQTQDGTFGGGDELVDVRNWELADLEAPSA
jgi:hypothetical protein